MHRPDAEAGGPPPFLKKLMAWLGPQVLDVRSGCEVCLVLGPDYQRPFTNWIGVAIDVT